MKINSELEKRLVSYSSRKNNSKNGTNSGKNRENFILGSCIEFFSGVLVTTAFGYFLDYIFNSRVVFSIIFLLLGFVIGFINIYRFVRVNKKL